MDEFEKLEIYWPVEMLREGIVLIDTPGITESYILETYFMDFIIKSDVILYCMSVPNSYSMSDKQILEYINHLGFSNPIIVNTFFDVLDEDELERFWKTVKNWYIQHTAEECCHYVSSRQGMEAKQREAHVAYVESGYSELEKFIGGYLQNRGKERLAKVVKLIEKYYRNQIVWMNGIINDL